MFYLFSCKIQTAIFTQPHTHHQKIVIIYVIIGIRHKIYILKKDKISHYAKLTMGIKPLKIIEFVEL